MILDESVLIKSRKSTKEWYKQKGYDVSKKEFWVKVNDLYPGAIVQLKCRCDFCGKIFYRKCSRVLNQNKHTCGDQECKKQLRKELCLEKFGVEHINQCKEIKEKGAKTFAERYGNGSDIHEEFIEKRKNTNIERYGNAGAYKHENSSKIRSKAVHTMISNFFNAKCRKGTKRVMASEQQVHICELLDGILNHKLGNKFVDIALDDCCIAIEYDGGGHQYWNSVHGNQDNLRDSEIFQLNWKLIRIVNNRDCKFVTDDELKLIINFCKEQFENYNLNLIIIDFVNRKIFSDLFCFALDEFLKKYLY